MGKQTEDIMTSFVEKEEPNSGVEPKSGDDKFVRLCVGCWI